jgi:hypothetical protein
MIPLFFLLLPTQNLRLIVDLITDTIFALHDWRYKIEIIANNEQSPHTHSVSLSPQIH